MNNFSSLLLELESIKGETKTTDALFYYLQTTPRQDALAGLSLLLGFKPPKVISPEKLKELALKKSGLTEYIFGQSQAITGDLIETISLITGNPDVYSELSIEYLLRNKYMKLQSADEEELHHEITEIWNTLPGGARILFNRLITGKFRAQVGRHQVASALAGFYRRNIREIYILLERHKFEQELLNSGIFNEKLSEKIYSAETGFCKYTAITEINENENKTHLTSLRGRGKRAQAEITAEAAYLWAEDGQLLNSYFPEVISACADIPSGTILEGELISPDSGETKSVLENRLRKKSQTTRSIIKSRIILVVHDCLIFNGAEITGYPATQRREFAQKAVEQTTGGTILMEEYNPRGEWKSINGYLSESISGGAEGLLVYPPESIYGEGYLLKGSPRKKEVVLLYAEQGKGNFAGIYSEYSWGIMKDDAYVVIARSNTGLTEEEIIKTDKFVKENRVERFGPVAVVPPVVRAEITYEREEKSKRHKAGVVLKNISNVKLIK
ncbi:MAG: hypothetical protein AMXMBFR48_30200 [Ignavibacteriales bacterium]